MSAQNTPALPGRYYQSGFVRKPCGAWFRHCDDRTWFCWGAGKDRVAKATRSAT